VPGCPQCQELLAQYEETLAFLPDALAVVGPLTLPPSLREWVLAAAANDLPRPVRAQHALPAPASSGLLSRAWGWLAGSRRSLLRAYPLAAAMLLLLLFVFAWSVSLNVTLARERSLRAGFVNLVDQQELVLEVVDSSKTTRRVLLPPEKGPPSYGKLYSRMDMAHVVAMVARLTAPAPGEAYHLWVVKGGETALAGLLTTNDEGFGLLIYDESEAGPIFDEALLTLQPTGETSPKLPPILRWRATP